MFWREIEIEREREREREREIKIRSEKMKVREGNLFLQKSSLSSLKKVFFIKECEKLKKINGEKLVRKSIELQKVFFLF